VERFIDLTGVAAPLRMINVDTDMIIPKQFLKTIKRSGLGSALFFELRTGEDGRNTGRFVLDQPAYRSARILITGDNFGCGSSREHAPWALLDFGIRCVIAPSFADIFYNNCFKNGILPMVLAAAQVERLMAVAENGANALFTVDLTEQIVQLPDGERMGFEIDPFRKVCLLGGLDDIGLTLQKADAIAIFEARQMTAEPWLFDHR
jgi:3-isopropylmalate/(R)-2-methylmalate dehydratase small subunit